MGHHLTGSFYPDGTAAIIVLEIGIDSLGTASLFKAGLLVAGSIWIFSPRLGLLSMIGLCHSDLLNS